MTITEMSYGTGLTSQGRAVEIRLGSGAKAPISNCDEGFSKQIKAIWRNETGPAAPTDAQARP